MLSTFLDCLRAMVVARRMKLGVGPLASEAGASKRRAARLAAVRRRTLINARIGAPIFRTGLVILSRRTPWGASASSRGSLPAEALHQAIVRPTSGVAHDLRCVVQSRPRDLRQFRVARIAHRVE